MCGYVCMVRCWKSRAEWFSFNVANTTTYHPQESPTRITHNATHNIRPFALFVSGTLRELLGKSRHSRRSRKTRTSRISKNIPFWLSLAPQPSALSLLRSQHSPAHPRSAQFIAIHSQMNRSSFSLSPPQHQTNCHRRCNPLSHKTHVHATTTMSFSA